MSQFEPRYAKNIPTFTKKVESDSKVLKEKQIGSLGVGAGIASKNTPQLIKKINTVNINRSANLKKTIPTSTNENRSTLSAVKSTKTSYKATPIAKGLLSKTGKIPGPLQNDSKMTTPLNRNIRNVFGSSIKQETSASKDNSARKLLVNNSRAAVLSAARANTTPMNRNYISSHQSSNKNSTQKTANQNPIVNGTDYSNIMARKAELGYTGVGYVVEYDCEDKDLKNINVSKGLWKITTIYNNNTPSKLQALMGKIVNQISTRLDEPSTHSRKGTPGKSIFHNIGYDWNPCKTTGILKNEPPARPKDLERDYHENSTAQMLDLETSYNLKSKKSLRWADILEKQYSPALINGESYTSPYLNSLTPKQIKSIDMNLLTGSLNCDANGSGGITKNRNSDTKKKMRRSLSMNDINNIIIGNDDDDVEEDDSKIDVSIDHKMKLTYSPNNQQESKSTNLNETFEIETPSKILIAKPTMMQPEMPGIAETDKPILAQSKVQTEMSVVIGETIRQEPMEYTLNSVEQQEIKEETNSLETSLNDLLIPFNLVEDNEKELEKSAEVYKDLESKVKSQPLNLMPYKLTDFIESLQACDMNLKMNMARLEGENNNNLLKVEPLEYMKISNLISGIESSLKKFNEKLSFQ